MLSSYGTVFPVKYSKHSCANIWQVAEVNCQWLFWTDQFTVLTPRHTVDAHPVRLVTPPTHTTKTHLPHLTLTIISDHSTWISCSTTLSLFASPITLVVQSTLGYLVICSLSRLLFCLAKHKTLSWLYRKKDFLYFYIILNIIFITTEDGTS